MTWFMQNFDADVDKIVLELITVCGLFCLQVSTMYIVVALSSPIYILFSYAIIMTLTRLSFKD